MVSSSLQTPSRLRVTIRLGRVAASSTVKTAFEPTSSAGTPSTGTTHENRSAGPV
jgi:hypothetical protein